jgi:hypothetical protein
MMDQYFNGWHKAQGKKKKKSEKKQKPFTKEDE